MKKNKSTIKKMCKLAVFIALCYVGVLINIPIPSPVGKPMFHLGNIFLLLASLLLGGVFGGIAGALGMGLYDITTGYGIWTLKTVCLKLVMGLTAGSVFAFLKKKNKPINRWIMFTLGAIFTLVGILLIGLRIGIGSLIQLDQNGHSFTITWPTYIFSLIIGILLMVSSFLMVKMPMKLQWATFATTLAVIVNIVGEFLFKILKTMIAGSRFKASFLLSVASIPASVINGTICIMAVYLLYMPLSHVFDNSIEK